MATGTVQQESLPILGSDTFGLRMTVLAEGGDNPQPAPPPGTLHDAAGGNRRERLAEGTEARATELDATGCWVHLTVEGGPEGWCHLGGLIPSTGRHVPWLEIAQREIGVSEADETGLARIGEYLASMKPAPKLGKDWCACFINWCMHKANTDPLDTPRARNWSKWGTRRTGSGRVPSDARLGDLAVGKLEAPEQGKPGHVAILLAYRPADDPFEDQLLLLGGNQSEHPLDGVKDKKTSVRYTWYPRQTLKPPSELVSVNFHEKGVPPA